MNTVSIIIPTYNGALKIPFLLNALLKQTFIDFEIVVVVDGSSDNTLEVLEKYKTIFKLMKIIHQDNGGRSKVRNRGVKESTGDLLIFYDDDMIPYPNSVNDHIKIHQDHNAALVTGNPMEYFDATKTDIQNYRAVLAHRWTQKYKKRINSLTHENLFFTAANCSFTRSLFEKLNGFDERLTDAEDYNLATRALEAGITVLFDKNNIGLHQNPVTATEYVLRMRQYKMAHQKLAELYPLPKKKLALVKSSIYKRIIYRIFATRYWLRMIDKESLIKLPTVIRYKLYDIIFHSLSMEYPDVEV